MLVQCPACRTTYRVSEDEVATPNPTFRCSRCKNVVVRGGKGQSKPARQRVESARAESPELSFTFDAPAPRAQEQPAAAEAAPATAEILPTANNPTTEEKDIVEAKDVVPEIPVNHKAERDWTLDERPAESDFAPRDTKPQARFEKPVEPALVFAREPQIKSENGAEAAAEGKRPLSIAPFFFLSGLLLLVFASVTLLYKTRPEPIEGVLKGVPLIGSSM